MPVVIDRTALCANGDLPLDPTRVRHVVVHRTSLRNLGVADVACDAETWAKYAKTHRAKLKTGGKSPYHFLILLDGTIEQALPLGVRGNHAAGYNAESWAAALVGDFRMHPPRPVQWRALVRLCSVLVPHTRGLTIVSHDQVRDPPKDCPGEGLSLPSLVAAVTANLERGPLGHGWRTMTREEIERSWANGGIHV